MKLKNLYLLSITLLAVALTACNDDTETFDNQVYVDASVKTSSILLKPSIPTVESQFRIAMAKPENQNVNISLKVEPALVETFNAAYYNNAEIVPAGYYTLETQQTVIPTGSVLSDVITVKFDKLSELDSEKVYVLPVTIEQANIGILQSARTMYYVLKGAALINVVADITENSVFVTWNTPEKVNGLRQLTAEVLIRVNKFGKEISTVMGIEGHFLLRIGDAGVPDNQLQIATSAGNVTSSDLVLPTGEWTHIAVTYDADAKKIIVYINGKNKLEVEKDCGAINWGQTKTNEGNGFWIGHSYNYKRWLEGEISECRVWNKVLTADDINVKDHFYEVNPDTEGLVGYWKFNEGVGTVIADHTGNGNNATALETITWNAVELPVK